MLLLLNAYPPRTAEGPFLVLPKLALLDKEGALYILPVARRACQLILAHCVNITSTGMQRPLTLTRVNDVLHQPVSPFQTLIFHLEMTPEIPLPDPSLTHGLFHFSEQKIA